MFNKCIRPSFNSAQVIFFIRTPCRPFFESTTLFEHTSGSVFIVRNDETHDEQYRAPRRGHGRLRGPKRLAVLGIGLVAQHPIVAQLWYTERNQRSHRMDCRVVHGGFSRASVVDQRWEKKPCQSHVPRHNPAFVDHEFYRTVASLQNELGISKV